MKYTIGVDYGTDSCRVLIVNASTGEEMATAVSKYPRWAQSLYCDPQNNQYRQHPLDYIETLEEAMQEALGSLSGEVKNNIVGISFDTTGSTPVLMNEEGIPLALLPEFCDQPNAMFVLWKDHTAIKEAAEINELAQAWSIDYTMYEGGVYSSEWVWAKVLHILREDLPVRKKAYSWIEHCDWMPALLTGRTKPAEAFRSRCAAGHKAMWNESWAGLPSRDFLNRLDPLLGDFYDHLYRDTYTCDKQVGYLTEEWAERLGLHTNVAVGVGALDCHMGAVGAQIGEGTFVRVMGTSTCDIMVVSDQQLKNRLIPGICGQVDGSVLPDMIGLEAGQSAFGDIYAWFKQLLVWPLKHVRNYSDQSDFKEYLEEIIDGILPTLAEEAGKLPITANGVLAIDWMNGRRTPDANQLLKGAIFGLTLGTDAPMIYRALVEATAYGSKAIVERFRENQIEIEEVIAIGGISQKSPFVMQVLADVLGMPIKVARAEQACALGASMYAAVVAGIYPDIVEAQCRMGQGFSCEYIPNVGNHKRYEELYREYLKRGDIIEKL